MSSASTSSITSASSSSSTSASTDWWCGGSGQVKWLTDVVAVGKSNDWLMQWYSNALSLALALALSLALALEIRATWRNFRYLIFYLVIEKAKITDDEDGPLKNKVIDTGNVRKVSLNTLFDNLNLKHHCFKNYFLFSVFKLKQFSFKARTHNCPDCVCNAISADFAGCCPCNCPCSVCPGQITYINYRCCTCSPPSSSSDSGEGCFPSFAKVNLENGKSVTMSELQVGDRVQTGIDVWYTPSFLSENVLGIQWNMKWLVWWKLWNVMYTFFKLKFGC